MATLATLATLAAVVVAIVVAVQRWRGMEAFKTFEIPEPCQARCSKCQTCRASQPGSQSSSQNQQQLPEPSWVDERCKTHMGDDPDDDGSCLALMYHECPEYGRTDEAMIPSWIRDTKQSAMDQIYELNKGCTSEEGAGKMRVPQYKCFTRPPRTWASVCVARPDKVGRGKCRSMKPDDWRVFVQGEDPLRTITCAGKDTPPSLYLKSHFRGTRIDEGKTGKVGRA